MIAFKIYSLVVLGLLLLFVLNMNLTDENNKEKIALNIGKTIMFLLIGGVFAYVVIS